MTKFTVHCIRMQVLVSKTVVPCSWRSQTPKFSTSNDLIRVKLRRQNVYKPDISSISPSSEFTLMTNFFCFTRTKKSSWQKTDAPDISFIIILFMVTTLYWAGWKMQACMYSTLTAWKSSSSIQVSNTIKKIKGPEPPPRYKNCNNSRIYEHKIKTTERWSLKR